MGKRTNGVQGRSPRCVPRVEYELAADLKDAVNPTKEIETLRRWLPLAVLAESIDAFRQQAGV